MQWLIPADRTGSLASVEVEAAGPPAFAGGKKNGKIINFGCELAKSQLEPKIRHHPWMCFHIHVFVVDQWAHNVCSRYVHYHVAPKMIFTQCFGHLKTVIEIINSARMPLRPHRKLIFSPNAFARTFRPTTQPPTHRCRLQLISLQRSPNCLICNNRAHPCNVISSALIAIPTHRLFLLISNFLFI